MYNLVNEFIAKKNTDASKFPVCCGVTDVAQ